MREDTKELMIFATFFMVFLVVITAIFVISETHKRTTAINAGLQECVVRSNFGINIVWQKECKDED